MGNNLTPARLVESGGVACFIDGEEVILTIDEFRKICRAHRQIQEMLKKAKMVKATLVANRGANAG